MQRLQINGASGTFRPLKTCGTTVPVTE